MFNAHHTPEERGRILSSGGLLFGSAALAGVALGVPRSLLGPSGRQE
jgi:hypothetical protein